MPPDKSYAARFALPVRSGVEVDRLARQGDGFVVESRDCRFEADQVVVAMGNFQRPWVPARIEVTCPRSPVSRE